MFLSVGQDCCEVAEVEFFLNAFEKIVEVATTEAGPFIYRIDTGGTLSKVL